MKNKKIVVFGLIILIAICIVILKFNVTGNNVLINKNQINVHDATYTINGEKVTLKNGVSERLPGNQLIYLKAISCQKKLKEPML